MAKGNQVLGTAANKLGDIVQYRREGQSISRVRVRNIKNPKTDAQSTQRAFFAPVQKFYSPLAVVLERSFEGLSKAKSANKFNGENVKLAKANDWLLPKGTGFFPLPYKLSQGTIQPVSTAFNADSAKVVVAGTTPASAPTTIGALSTFFKGLGYADGDVVTIILISGSMADGFYPVHAQFAIDATSEANIADKLPGMAVTLGTQDAAGIMLNTAAGSVAAGAVIVARYENEKWRRSTQTLAVDSTILDAIAEADYKAAAVASYGPTAGTINPLVYLDGETVNPL